MDGEVRDAAVNEFSGFMCGVKVDMAMYPQSYLYANGTQTLSLTPNEAVAASYAVTPAMPEGLTLDASTGVIEGSSAGLKQFNSFTVTRSTEAGKSKFFLVIETGKGWGGW